MYMYVFTYRVAYYHALLCASPSSEYYNGQHSKYLSMYIFEPKWKHVGWNSEIVEPVGLKADKWGATEISFLQSIITGENRVCEPPHAFHVPAEWHVQYWTYYAQQSGCTGSTDEQNTWNQPQTVFKFMQKVDFITFIKIYIGHNEIESYFGHVSCFSEEAKRVDKLIVTLRLI